MHPSAPSAPRTAEGQKALESELETARGRNVARGRAAESAAKGVAKGIAPPPDPAGKPASPAPQ